jgi:hypothetical protein
MRSKIKVALLSFMLVIVAVSAWSMAAQSTRQLRTIQLTRATKATFTEDVRQGQIPVVPNRECIRRGTVLTGNQDYRWCLTTKGELVVTPAGDYFTNQQDCEWDGCSCNGQPCGCHTCVYVQGEWKKKPFSK